VSKSVHLIGPYPLGNHRKGFIASLSAEDSADRCVSVRHSTTNAWNQNYNTSNPGNQNNNNKNNTNYVRAVRRPEAMTCA
jgi:hypothetical protein